MLARLFLYRRLAHCSVALPHLPSAPFRSAAAVAAASAARLEVEGRVLGIRREESSLWERRAPLSPNNVQSLVSKGAKVNGVCACITYMCVYVYVCMYKCSIKLQSVQQPKVTWLTQKQSSMHVCINVYTLECMYVFMYLCMYVCMYVCCML